MIERRQDMHDQFDRLFDKMTTNHEETIQRLTKIETFQKTDRADLDEIKEDHEKLKTQCDEHERIADRGKWLFGLISLVGVGTLWQYAKALLHLDKAAK